MLSKINYSLIIKFWILCFFKELSLLPLLVITKAYPRHYSICVYFAFLNGYSLPAPGNATFLKSTLDESLKLKVCMLQLSLQQKLCVLLYKQVQVVCCTVVRLLTAQDWSRVFYLYHYIKLYSKQLADGNMSINFEHFILTAHFAIIFRRPGALVSFVTHMFSISKKHNMFISFLRRFLKEFLKHYAELAGLQFLISGKINGVQRTRQFLIRQGVLELSSKASSLYYSIGTSLTFTGIFGVKLWFNYRDSKC